MDTRHGVTRNGCDAGVNLIQTRVPRAEYAAFPDKEADNQSTTAIVIERRPLIRDLLSRCLAWASGFDVIAVATVDDSIECTSSLNARVVLLSVIGSPESAENQRVIRRSAQVFSGVPVVILSDVEDLQQVVSVLRAGSRGYISTGMSLDVAVEALRLVRAGGQFLPANCVVGADQVQFAPADHSEPVVTGMFTVRQAAVVEALRRGKANKIIAYELNMRESTVKVHVRNIMKRLNAKNRTEVAYIVNQIAAGNTLCEVNGV